MRLAVRLYNRWDRTAPIRTLTGARNKSFTQRINEPGVGSFDVGLHDLDGLTLNRYLVAVFNDEDAAALAGYAPVFQMFLDNVELVWVDSGERAEERLRVTGKGVMSMLEEAVIYPEGFNPGATDQFLPIEKRRPFNFSGRDYIETGWVAAKDMIALGASPWTGVTGMPVPTARWIWPATAQYPNPHITAARGKCYFRRWINLAASARVMIYMACDNFARLFLDGTEILTTPEFANAPADVAKVELDVTKGYHLFAIEATNAGTQDGPAGVIFGMNSLSGTFLLRSDATWNTLAYPATFPGMAPGEILAQLVADTTISSRPVWWQGQFGPTVLAFEGWVFNNNTYYDKDSNGKPWPLIDVTAEVGQNLWEFIASLLGTYLDIELVDKFYQGRFDTHVYSLKAYNPGTMGNVVPTLTLKVSDSPAAGGLPSSGNLQSLRESGPM